MAVRRILNYMRKDLAIAGRDNILLYMLIAPLLLAVLMRFLLPGVQAAGLTFAVDKAVEQRVITALADYGRVELYDGDGAVRERVERVDDVPGIIQAGDGYLVLAEGNETGEIAVMADSILERILSAGPRAELARDSLERTGSRMRETTASLLLLSSILIAGLFVGFNLIDEKEGNTLRALAVSPLSLSEYVGSRAVLITGIALFTCLLSALILFGFRTNYPQLIIGTLCSIGLGIFIGFLIGGIADNQITGIAVVKVSMLFMTGIPMASLFAPRAYLWVFYPFPNFWVFQIFQNVFTGVPQAVGFGTACLLTLVTSGILLLAMLPFFRRLRLR